MADDIQLKRSNVPGLAPAASELLEGELAFNTYDGKLYAKDASGSVFVVNPSASLVDIVAGSDNVTVEIAAGVATVSVDAPPVSWGDIVGRPTKVSELENDSGFVNALDAADASPVQGIVGSNAAIVTTVGRLFTVDVPLQQQANWAESDDASVAFVQNKPTALSQFVNDSAFVDAAGAAAAAPVKDIVGAGEVQVSAQDGVYTVSSPARVQANWAQFDTSDPSFILNKPTDVSAFNNDANYVDAAGASAAAPIQSIAAADSSVTVVSDDSGNYTLRANLIDQAQADWAQADADAGDYIKNKPTSLSDFSNDPNYVNAEQAADAAPVQDIVGGDNITVVRNAGVYTVSASGGGVVLGVSGVSPIVVGGEAGNPTIGVSEATQAQLGVVQRASEADVVGGAAGRVIDAAQLKAAIPTKLSQLSNDANYVSESFVTSAVSGFLSTTGGTLTGPLVIAPTGSVSAPTPAIGDSSSALATTEWVQRELAGVVEVSGLWEHGGADTSADPTSGFVRVSADGAFLAISKYALDGFVPAATALPVGSIIELSVVPPLLTGEDGVVFETVSGLSITTE